VTERGPSVADLLATRAERTPDRTLVTFDGGGSWSCEQSLHLSWSVAAGLAAVGVAPGDPVLSWLPNGPESIATLFGANAAGAVYAPLNVAYRGRLLEHAVNLVRAEVMVAHADLIERLAGLTLPHLRVVVIVGSQPPVNLPNLRVLSWNELSSQAAVAPSERCRRRPEDDMVYVYTSGTTGPSKAVRCSHLLHDAYADWFRQGDLGGDDRALVALPMYHVVGTGWTYSMLRWGGSIAVAPRFVTDTFWDTVNSLGVTTTTVMAAMGAFLMARPEAPADSEVSLRIALVVPAFAGVHDFGRRFNVEMWTGYAMSEVPGPLRTQLNTKNFRTAGTPSSPEWQVELVDDDNQPVADGTVGELCVRHEVPGVVTSGYVNMLEATDSAWQAGWFHTGDLFRRETDGNYYFVDRNSDALRRRGENISSIELEQEINAHPAVFESAVVGVPAAEAEDEVMALVVLREGAEATERELFEFLIPRVPHYMVPRYVEFVRALPRTPTEKVRKTELRDRGVTATTWDSRAEGLIVKATRIGEGVAAKVAQQQARRLRS
jgi:carnitine-CoA ligase